MATPKAVIAGNFLATLLAASSMVAVMPKLQRRCSQPGASVPLVVILFVRCLHWRSSESRCQQAGILCFYGLSELSSLPRRTFVCLFVFVYLIVCF